MKYETRITEVTVLPEGGPLFHECATVIRIDDEAAGEFVLVSQDNEREGGSTLTFDVDDWSMVRGEIDAMVARCRKEEL